MGNGVYRFSSWMIHQICGFHGYDYNVFELNPVRYTFKENSFAIHEKNGYWYL